MTTMPDLAPAAERLNGVLAGVPDDLLGAPTPCPQYSLGDLIDHINGLTIAFRYAAMKEQLPGGPQGPSGDAGRLGTGWRTQIPEQLQALVAAWTDPDAWDGMTRAGGIELPGQVCGLVALDELVVHAWDVSRAIDRPYDIDEASVAACTQFLAMSADDRPGGGPFGPVVPVGDDATALDRLIGLSGRDPAWQPASR